LFRRLMPLIPIEGLPDPVEVIVKPVKVTGTTPVLAANTWTTGRLAVPCNWVELGGAEGPEEMETVEGVGVKVAATTGVLVAVLVVVRVAVSLAVGMGLLVGVGVAVFVAKGVSVGL
jgi:hypothetical protein